MNIILFQPSELCSEKILKLTDHRHLHIQSILKAKPNQQLTVGEYNGNIGHGNIIHINSSETHLKIDLQSPPPPPLPIKLILAMPRPKVLKRVIYNATTMGIKEFHIFNSWRVEKSFWKSPVVEDGALTQYMLEGLEQAKDTKLPCITFHRFFKDFIQDCLPSISQDTEKLVAHPYNSDTDFSVIQPNRYTTLIIGPEGGFIEREVKSFQELGFLPTQIGTRILKVETAVTALISRISF